MPEKLSKIIAHNKIKEQHISELAEDYVAEIQRLTKGSNIARVVDLTRAFGVSHVSVIRALNRLEKKELLKKDKDKGIILTEKGVALAKESTEKHELIVRFLCSIGVSLAQAKIEAEGIEHHISEETMIAMRKQLKC